MTRSGRVAASLFCSSQWLSFKACFIMLTGRLEAPQEQLKGLLFSHPSLENVLPVLLLRLKSSRGTTAVFKGALETGGVLEGGEPTGFLCPPRWLSAV